MPDYKVAQTQDETCARYERLGTDELLAVVDRALSWTGEHCQECNGSRVVFFSDTVQYELCPECGG